MSGPSGAPSPAQRSTSIGPNAVAMGLPPQPQPTPGGMGNVSSSGGGGQQPMSQQNLNQIVIEYLNKKGYSKTEAMLRMESSNQEIDPSILPKPSSDADRIKYTQAYDLLRVWIEDNLDVYKPELRRILWPVFVYSFLNLVSEGYPEEAKRFFEMYKDHFTVNHENELRQLTAISLPEHLQDSAIAKTYRSQGSKYRFSMSTPCFNNLIMFLESKQKQGGGTIQQIITQSIHINTVDRAADDRFSLAAMLARSSADDQDLEEDEGIPGHRAGAPNTGSIPDLLPKLKLGKAEMEADKRTDVRAELAEEDRKNPAPPGDKTLVQEFEQMIKVEDDEFVESPQLHDVPYPKPTVRDVALEVQRVKENRDRFKIEGRTGGIGPGVTVCMFTLHNTYDSICCLDIDDAQLLLAAGTSDSVIRVWSLDGEPLPCLLPQEADRDHGSTSRRLVGHAGPVYGVHFQPSAGGAKPLNPDFDTKSKWLLSCSYDTTIGLWSLDTYQMMVQYKGHCQPVWDVSWGPYGHYFLTGGHDKTARLWSTDNISCIRIFAGHDNDVDVVCFHPNTAYVFSGSCDKTIRMWSVTTGNPVRMFTGHAGNVTALACSPSGKLLASADDAGTICLWALAPGRLVKRMRGHGKGGIWSLSWSVESTVITSSGADGTVRVWDVHGPATDTSQGKVVGEGGAGTKIDVGTSTGTASVVAGKKKGNLVVTPDQISAFPTKKTPVLMVKFSHMNLVLAGGAYSPNN